MIAFRGTPGEWESVEYGPRPEDGPIAFKIQQVGSRMPIAITADYSAKDDANARLIAAAPELLEALQAIYRFADILRPGFAAEAAMPGGSEAANSYEDAMRAADAAIARALGEVPA